MTYRIDPVDPRVASDAELAPIAELVQTMQREREPEDPLPPLEVTMQRMRAFPDVVVPTGFVARAEDGAIAGLGYIFRFKVEQNQHLREVHLDVHPAHRRRGLGRELLSRVAGAAGEGELLLMGSTVDRVPAGEAFASRIGAQPALVTKTSQLVLAAVDPGLVRDWIALAPAGYRLAWVEGGTPAELVPNVLVAYDTMNTAPRGDLKMDDWRMSEEILRQFEASRRAQGRQRWLLLALATETDETAGFTEVSYDPRVPHLVQQQGTAVVPAHRGRKIGKWLKATMLDRILRERPSARFVRTGNAEVNAPMLAINTELGFRPAWSGTEWQVTLAQLRGYLSSRAERQPA